MQLRLAGTIAADRVEVDARAHHVVGQDRRLFLVRRACGDDLRARDSVFGRGAGRDLQPRCRQIAHRLGRGVRVDIVKPHFLDTQNVMEGQRLKLALRAVADHRHDLCVFRGQMAGGHDGRRRRAQRRQNRHFGQQDRVTVVDPSQNPESRHGLEPAPHVRRVPVDVFESIPLAVRGRHQLDHPFGGMGGHAGGLVEIFPAQEIRLDPVGDGGDGLGHAIAIHDAHHVVDRHKGHHGHAGRVQVGHDVAFRGDREIRAARDVILAPASDGRGRIYRTARRRNPPSDGLSCPARP